MIFGTQFRKWILIILVNLLRCVPWTSLAWWHNVNWRHWNHAVHRARDTVNMLQRDAKSLSLQRCGHPIRHIWIRWTTASVVSFKRESTVRRFMMWRSWKNVCWVEAAEPHRHRHFHRGSDSQWRSCLNACVYVNGGNFEHKFWASDFLLCFVCFTDTGLRKCDRYKHVQSANIVWNVLLLCLRLSYGMVAT